MRLAHAAYRTVVVNLDLEHRAAVADAGIILLGVYTHDGPKLVRKRWLHVAGPDMPAQVRRARAHSHAS